MTYPHMDRLAGGGSTKIRGSRERQIRLFGQHPIAWRVRLCYKRNITAHHKQRKVTFVAELL